MGWVADVGGTNTRLALVERSRGVVIESRKPTPVDPDPQALLDLLDGLQHEMRSRAQLPMVLGIPGLVDSEHGRSIRSANLGWVDVAIRDLAARRFGVPVQVENDVRLHTLGEWRFGQGQGLTPGRAMANVVIGTGIAAGIVVHGQLLSSAQSGEIGHLTWDRAGVHCGCGKTGCVETVVGAKGLTRMVRQSGRRSENFVDDVVTPLERGQTWAISVWQEFVRALAFALSSLVLLVQPEIIVLSGGVSRSYPLWQPMLTAELSHEVFIDSMGSLRITTSRLGDEAPYLGGMHLLFGSQ